ncbi:MAG TPA: hypothetical protein VMH27_00195 [Puia sp.]|nr:hypothetical protein [Puia sp.]
MGGSSPAVFHQLQQEILLRQGFKPPSAASVDMGLGPVAAAFPHGSFPTGAMHELLSKGPEGFAASGAFTAALVGRLMEKGGACLWIGQRQNCYPPGFAAFGVEADRVVFVEVRKEKEALWVLEEALKCEGLAAVVGEVREVGWVVSRRFQLAVEQSRVTGFLLRDRPKSRQPIAAVARWEVRPIPGVKEVAGARGPRSDMAMPGVGFPRWSVELLRMRSGSTGKWELEWRDGRFYSIGEDVATKKRVPWVNDSYHYGSVI